MVTRREVRLQELRQPVGGVAVMRPTDLPSLRLAFGVTDDLVGDWVALHDLPLEVFGSDIGEQIGENGAGRLLIEAELGLETLG